MPPDTPDDNLPDVKQEGEDAEKPESQPAIGEILDQLDPNSDGGAVVSRLGLMVQAVLRSGPLPPSEEFKAYNQVLPGAADRILSMAEREQEQRLERASRQLDANIRDSGRGVTCAFVLGMTAIIGGTVATIMSSAWAGSLISIAGLASLTSTFIYGTRGKERSSRKRQAEREPEKPAE